MTSELIVMQSLNIEAIQIEAINETLDQLREKPAPKRNKIGYK